MNNPNGLSCWKCSSPISICCDLSGWSLVEYILFCHVLWWISYYFLLVITKQSEEWCCRFLTFAHGCLVSYSAMKDAYLNKSPVDFQSVPLTMPKKYYLSYMLSYFLFDFSWIHFFGNETWIIYVHHLASVLIILNVLIKNYGAAGVAYGAAGLEFTNPYLQLRWFLRTHGLHSSIFHKITELWFMAIFFIIRTLGGTILMYYSVMYVDLDYGMKISFLSIYGISLVLQWQIFMYFRKKYLRSDDSANIHLTNSRASISPYFQRRTLDRENRNLENTHSSIQNGTKIAGTPGSASPQTESSSIRAGQSPTQRSFKAETITIGSSDIGVPSVPSSGGGIPGMSSSGSPGTPGIPSSRSDTPKTTTPRSERSEPSKGGGESSREKSNGV